jgi:hypothetical protein
VGRRLTATSALAQSRLLRPRVGGATPDSYQRTRALARLHPSSEAVDLFFRGNGGRFATKGCKLDFSVSMVFADEFVGLAVDS